VWIFFLIWLIYFNFFFFLGSIILV
jgi:hypothetical protein